MNMLQQINVPQTICVSLNEDRTIDERKIIRAVESAGYRATVAGADAAQPGRAARLATVTRLAFVSATTQTLPHRTSPGNCPGAIDRLSQRRARFGEAILSLRGSERTGGLPRPDAPPAQPPPKIVAITTSMARGV